MQLVHSQGATGVIYQNVDMFPWLRQRLDRRSHTCPIAHVEFDRNALGLIKLFKRGRQRLDFVDASGAKDQFGAGLGEGFGAGFTDAAAGTADKNDLSFKWLHKRNPPFNLYCFIHLSVVQGIRIDYVILILFVLKPDNPATNSVDLIKISLLQTDFWQDESHAARKTWNVGE